MHYVFGDIHNNCYSFERMLEKINLSNNDTIILLGDIFDRNDYNPNPVDLYFRIQSMRERCVVVRGNHDEWLANYIIEYMGKKNKKRSKMEDYYYNSFSLLKSRLTDVDMLNLAKQIKTWPLQVNMSIDGKEFLFGHAMTSSPNERWFDQYYLMGSDEDFYNCGIDGFISFCGHMNTSNLVTLNGVYLRKERPSIWVNKKGNVYMMDCGCGFLKGQLAVYCIETGDTYYMESGR